MAPRLLNSLTGSLSVMSHSVLRTMRCFVLNIAAKSNVKKSSVTSWKKNPLLQKYKATLNLLYSIGLGRQWHRQICNISTVREQSHTRPTRAKVMSGQSYYEPLSMMPRSFVYTHSLTPSKGGVLQATTKFIYSNFAKGVVENFSYHSWFLPVYDLILLRGFTLQKPTKWVKNVVKFIS